MKAKKLYKYFKKGEMFIDGTLWWVANLRKRMVKTRTCRFQKHKNKDDECE